jgi:hypothetical protein
LWLDAYKMAAVASVEPWPFTFAELRAMSEHKRNDEWDHTAAVRLQVAVANAKPGRTMRLADFHPFMQTGNRGDGKPLDKARGAKLLDSVFGVTDRQVAREPTTHRPRNART